MRAFWMVLEIFHDPTLLSKVRAELQSCTRQPPSPGEAVTGDPLFDIEQPLRSPLLQSIYAETLRLHVHVFIVRAPKRFDMKIKDWLIPSRKTLLVSSTPAHMDAQVWNTGVHNSNDEHSVDGFWAERFLKIPGVAESGPRKSQASPGKERYSEPEPGTGPGHGHGYGAEPTFALDDVKGAWISYGEGPRMVSGAAFCETGDDLYSGGDGDFV